MRALPVPSLVILPSAYNTYPTCPYATFYLLHGAGETYKAWSLRANLTALADNYSTIIVTPDGGERVGTWTVPLSIVGEYQYETFVSTELVGYIDDNYRTHRDAKRRAIGGNSMGGAGALYVAIRHSDVFGTAVSLSGGVDLRLFPEQWDIKLRLGPIDDHPERWEEHSVVTQAAKRLDQSSNLNLALDCGTEDFFLGVNRALHQQLLEMKVLHDYTERPGGHGWPYWKKAILYQMVYVGQHVNW
eukprot:CAMPEP_0178545570 /NCGR_PEP_ID=MMETSP0697-20121206/3704_1 /TAXON_ID=265572 /ORGANISM="Extubocellulus spinifer, Strain CCMP396" /LENGTH=244 /DNA_ID=CAMNT_0020178129 /DNA_START=696 /DNA_END=1428 /DNA_ORIENTATION=+